VQTRYVAATSTFSVLECYVAISATNGLV